MGLGGCKFCDGPNLSAFMLECQQKRCPQFVGQPIFPPSDDQACNYNQNLASASAQAGFAASPVARNGPAGVETRLNLTVWSRWQLS